MLQCVAVCCSVLQCVAVCCSVVVWDANSFQDPIMCVCVRERDCVCVCVAVCCSVLQCVAVCCSKLQRVAVWLHEMRMCFKFLVCVCVRERERLCVCVCCSVLHCVAVCCIVWQCVAVCCSVLQRGCMGREFVSSPRCVCVCERERETVSVFVSQRDAVCCMCCSVLQCVAVWLYGTRIRFKSQVRVSA